MAKISIGDHVHYAPDNLEAETAALTPTYIVVFTGPEWSAVVQVGTQRLTDGYFAPTKDLVPASPDDPTEIQPVGE